MPPRFLQFCLSLFLALTPLLPLQLGFFEPFGHLIGFASILCLIRSSGANSSELFGITLSRIFSSISGSDRYLSLPEAADGSVESFDAPAGSAEAFADATAASACGEPGQHLHFFTAPGSFVQPQVLQTGCLLAFAEHDCGTSSAAADAPASDSPGAAPASLNILSISFLFASSVKRVIVSLFSLSNTSGCLDIAAAASLFFLDIFLFGFFVPPIFLVFLRFFCFSLRFFFEYFCRNI